MRARPEYPPATAFRHSGFTLLELSIVFIIIALITGSIMVGTELINNARNLRQVAELDKYSKAADLFRAKYANIPGDMTVTEAAAQGLSINDPCSTCGNGRIDDEDGASPIAKIWIEPYYFFIQLDQAELIEGDYAFTTNSWTVGKQFAPLVSNSSAGITVSSYLGDIWFYMGISAGNTHPTSTIAVLSTQGVMLPSEAEFIDQKIDDGIPSTGGVRAVTHTNGTLDTTASSCVTSVSATLYNVGDSQRRCRLYVKKR